MSDRLTGQAPFKYEELMCCVTISAKITPPHHWILTANYQHHLSTIEASACASGSLLMLPVATPSKPHCLWLFVAKSFRYPRFANPVARSDKEYDRFSLPLVKQGSRQVRPLLVCCVVCSATVALHHGGKANQKLIWPGPVSHSVVCWKLWRAKVTLEGFDLVPSKDLWKL